MESERFISRTKDREHAELVAIREISKWLDKLDLTEQTEISLTMMVTSSPCLDCQPKILDMLVDWRERLELNVSYKLRISYLYHDLAPTQTAPRKRLSDSEVRVKLAEWKRDIKDSGVEFTLEPIAVCDELPHHKPRRVKCDSCKKPKASVVECPGCEELSQKTIPKRKKSDEAIANHVQYINTNEPQPNDTDSKAATDSDDEDNEADTESESDDEDNEADTESESDDEDNEADTESESDDEDNEAANDEFGEVTKQLTAINARCT